MRAYISRSFRNLKGKEPAAEVVLAPTPSTCEETQTIPDVNMNNQKKEELEISEADCPTPKVSVDLDPKDVPPVVLDIASHAHTENAEDIDIPCVEVASERAPFCADATLSLSDDMAGPKIAGADTIEPATDPSTDEIISEQSTPVVIEGTRFSHMTRDELEEELILAEKRLDESEKSHEEKLAATALAHRDELSLLEAHLVSEYESKYLELKRQFEMLREDGHYDTVSHRELHSFRTPIKGSEIGDDSATYSSSNHDSDDEEKFPDVAAVPETDITPSQESKVIMSPEYYNCKRGSMKNVLDAVVELVQETKAEYEQNLEDLRAQLAALGHREFRRPVPSKPPRSIKISDAVRVSPRFKSMSEKDALIAMFEIMDGAKWARKDNWDSSKSLGEWYGITVDDEEHVIKLDLRTNNLTGNLPGAIGNLLYCREIYLSGNYLKGALPEALGWLPSLEILNLTDNSFNGSFPDMSGATSLKQLLFSRNSLNGVIPRSIQALVCLEILDAQANKLHSNIPDEIGCLTMLREIRLNNNELSGHLPISIGSLANLEVMDLSSNALSGPLEESIFDQKSTLRELNLSKNQLDGSLPLSLYSVSALEIINLQENRFVGDVSTIFALPHLHILNLSQNGFVGCIPPCVGDLTDLREIILNINNFSGEIPRDIGKCLKLQRIVLSGNALVGPIPETITSLVNLKSLFLAKNRLTGGIPTLVGCLTNLVHLHLTSNQLSGPLPDSLSNLTNLKQLFLNNNKFSGGSFGGIVFGITKSKVQAALPKCIINV